MVGTGLAGGSAAASLAELGYNVKCFCFQDSPRRAHSHRRPGRHQRRQELPERRRQRLPALLRHDQGRRLPLPRGQRLPPGPGQRRTSSTSASPRACRSPASTAACSTTAPSAAPRCSRTFYARGQTGQQLLLGAYQALERQIGARQRSKMHTRARDARPGRRRRPGPRHRRPRPGHRRDRDATSADAVVLATGGYGNVFYLSTNAKGCNVTATWRAHRKGALLRQPLLHPDPPDLHPGHRRPPVQADADARVAAQRRPDLGAEERTGDKRPPRPDPRGRARLLPRAEVPGFGNLVPARHRLPGRPRRCATRAAASARAGCGVYLDFADAIERLGRDGDRGQATATCSTCTSGSPARTRTRCRCGSTRPSTTRWAGCGSTTT